MSPIDLSDNILTALIAASGLVIGVILTSSFALLQYWLTRRFEDRRIVADLIGKLALEQWKSDRELAIQTNAELQRAKLSDPVLAGNPFLGINTPTIAEVTKKVAVEIEAIYYKPGWFVRTYRRLCKRN